MKMSEPMICRICLQTEAKMFRWDRSDLKYYYVEVISLKLYEKDELPQYFCCECATLLHKFHKFKELCYRGLHKLQELLCKGPITLERICQIDRKIINLTSSLGILTVSRRVKTYSAIANLSSDFDVDSDKSDNDSVDDKNVVQNIAREVNFNKGSPFLDPDDHGDVFKDIHGDNNPVHSDDEKPLIYYKGLETILKVDIADGSSTTLSVDEGKEKIKIKSQSVKGSDDTAGTIIKARNKSERQKEHSPKKIIKRTKKQKESQIKKIVKLNDKPNIKKGIKIIKNIAPIKKSKKPNKLAMKKQKKSLDVSHWKKYTLSEEEAFREFREKGESPRFATWPFKCLDCFKGFSKEKLLKDHRRLKHDESLQHECRFCHMRYKWNAKMREHMRQHFNKFQCLRCDYVCPLEHTASLHDDVHNGVIKKCEFCNAEFTHLMSYYSHRRSHKSQYACSHCGVSFMSRRGLNMHKRVKHIDDEIDSPDDENNGKTFCEKCDIRFETKKAYNQHLFHSAMHVQGIDNDSKEESADPKKVKEAEKTEISKELSKSKTIQVGPLGSFKFPGIGKRRRSFKKPMDCYQCGKHFETQQECRKHHLAEHPRTSFFPPSERHICEICGASLAPDSVAHHLNTHTREKVYPCVTCGRHFHASVNLKRHMLTHTGEKPYSCSLCDKKFTQPTNMKLHYKIYHFKESIPKRVRRKKDNLKTDHNAGDFRTQESSQSPPNAPAITSESGVKTTLPS